MSTFYLKYTNDNWASDTKITVNAYIRNVYTPITERITGVNLNGTNYAHKLYSKNVRLINLSADYLTTTNIAEIKNFYLAGAWKYSSDDSTYDDVILQEAGEMPLEYIEGHTDLPDLTITLIDKEVS